MAMIDATIFSLSAAKSVFPHPFGRCCALRRRFSRQYCRPRVEQNQIISSSTRSISIHTVRMISRPAPNIPNCLDQPAEEDDDDDTSAAIARDRAAPSASGWRKGGREQFLDFLSMTEKC